MTASFRVNWARHMWLSPPLDSFAPPSLADVARGVFSLMEEPLSHPTELWGKDHTEKSSPNVSCSFVFPQEPTNLHSLFLGSMSVRCLECGTIISDFFRHERHCQRDLDTPNNGFNFALAFRALPQRHAYRIPNEKNRRSVLVLYCYYSFFAARSNDLWSSRGVWKVREHSQTQAHRVGF